MRASLTTARQTWGDEHLDVADALAALATLLGEDLDDHAAAKPLLQESIEICHTLLPADHPRIARAADVRA